ncbi:MAG: ribonuclease PH [Myxococcales bacterium]|jgi:ribonuclease PH|nr:ribonuclease PH [Myxococcales bacterium]
MRSDDRLPDALRDLSFQTNFLTHAEGSVLVRFGQTRVLCTASVEERQPQHLSGTTKGWVTAEYGMLPRATHTRTKREAARGQQTGRTIEIQRLIGRSLRAAIDLDLLGPRTITIDCDVLEADGGTRTASITGGFVALALATRKLRSQNVILQDPIRFPVAAISVGIIDGEPRLDLDYAEDSSAEVDMNVIGTATGAIVEVQGTAEGKVFERRELDQLLDLAFKGIREITNAQMAAVG